MNLTKAALVAFQMVLDRYGYFAELAILLAAAAVVSGLLLASVFVACRK